MVRLENSRSSVFECIQDVAPPLSQSIFWDAPVVAGDAPAPRSGHSFTAVGERFFVFGGCGRVGGKAQAFNDIKELDTQVGDDRPRVKQ